MVSQHLRLTHEPLDFRVAAEERLELVDRDHGQLRRSLSGSSPDFSPARRVQKMRSQAPAAGGQMQRTPQRRDRVAGHLRPHPICGRQLGPGRDRHQPRALSNANPPGAPDWQASPRSHLGAEPRAGPSYLLR
jgi:hypothetical protein